MSKCTTFITGANGFVGRNLAKRLSTDGHTVHRVDIVASDTVQACDVSDPTQLMQSLKACKPDVIVHCAARKNLSDCEENKLASFVSNSLSTEIIAEYARRTQAKVVYLSSDVIFNGQRGNYRPEDPIHPINWYGKTKAFSETILQTVDNVAICRTALVIGKLSNEYKQLLQVELSNEVLVNQTLLPQYIYERLRTGQTVRLPRAIISNPTPVELLCDMVVKIIEQDARGTFHATGPDALSRYETGLLIADVFRFDPQLVIEDDGNISLLRPHDISMDSEGTFKHLGIDIADWRLADYLADRELYV